MSAIRIVIRVPVRTRVAVAILVIIISRLVVVCIWVAIIIIEVIPAVAVTDPHAQVAIFIGVVIRFFIPAIIAPVIPVGQFHVFPLRLCRREVNIIGGLTRLVSSTAACKNNQQRE